MRHIAAKDVLQLLSDEQNQHCIKICREFQGGLKVTWLSFEGDGSWDYDPETKQKSS